MNCYNGWLRMGGYGHDYRPIDDQGFLQFAQSPFHPAFYQVLAKTEPLSDIRAHRATAKCILG